MLIFDFKENELSVRLEGEIDHSTAASVRRELDALILDPRVKRLVFDLTRLDFMDSSGIGLLIGRYKQMAKRGGSVAVVPPRDGVDRVLRMSGVYNIIERLAQGREAYEYHQ